MTKKEFLKLFDNVNDEAEVVVIKERIGRNTFVTKNVEVVTDDVNDKTFVIIKER